MTNNDDIIHRIVHQQGRSYVVEGRRGRVNADKPKPPTEPKAPPEFHPTPPTRVCCCASKVDDIFYQVLGPIPFYLCPRHALTGEGHESVKRRGAKKFVNVNKYGGPPKYKMVEEIYGGKGGRPWDKTAVEGGRITGSLEPSVRRLFEPKDKVALPRYDYEATVKGVVVAVSDDTCRLLKVKLKDDGQVVLAEKKWTRRLK